LQAQIYGKRQINLVIRQAYIQITASVLTMGFDPNRDT
jgi:hypothetical protein